MKKYIIIIFIVAALHPVKSIATTLLDDNDSTLTVVAGDTILKNTLIQNAINYCSTTGGGTVRLTLGTYRTAPFVMKSNVNLHIDSGAVLLGSPIMSDWSISGSLLNLIGGKNLTNVSFTGAGTIDGSGAPWWAAYNANNTISRPRLLYVTGVTNLTIDSLTVQNSPSFHIVPNQCVNVVINNVKVYAPATSPNTDAIDPSYCRNVLISNTSMDVGDDCIAIKSGRVNGALIPGISQDITIENCTFLHGHGLSVGSETDNGLRNLRVTGCTFNGTTNGIRLKSGAGLGGLMQNLYYSNITMKKVTNPIVVDLNYSTSTAYPTDIPSINGFYINNLTVTQANNAGTIAGITNGLVKNINFSNFNITATHGMTISNAAGVVFSNWKINGTNNSSNITATNNVTGIRGF